jgi:O-antigen/teichoic acid export membrane protein
MKPAAFHTPLGLSAEPARTGGFRSIVLRAAGWSMGGYLAGYVLRILSSLIMTRLLVPEMFGIMAVASVVQVVVAMLSDVGLRQSVVQSHRGDAQEFLDTAWTLQTIRGVLIWFICVGVALVIGQAAMRGWFEADSVYAAAQLPLIIAATAFTSVIMGFESTKSMTSDRHLNLKRVSIIEISSQIAGLVVAVVLGWLTRSIWSFVISGFVAAGVKVALTHFYLPGPRNHFRFEARAATELMLFGRWIMLSSLFSVLAANGDRILLAGWISPTELGFYVLAFNLVAMVEGGGGRLFWSIATPALSQVARERPKAIRDVYYKFRLPFDIAFIGSAGALYGGGGALIDLLYDQRYLPSSGFLEILSFGLFFARFGVVGPLYVALGMPRSLSLINLVRTVSLFSCMLAANLLFGFNGIAWAIALHGCAVLPFVFGINRSLGLNRIGFELAILAVWPIGYAAGLLATHLVTLVGSAI